MMNQEVGERAHALAREHYGSPSQDKQMVNRSVFTCPTHTTLSDTVIMQHKPVAFRQFLIYKYNYGACLLSYS